MRSAAPWITASGARTDRATATGSGGLVQAGWIRTPRWRAARARPHPSPGENRRQPGLHVPRQLPLRRGAHRHHTVQPGVGTGVTQHRDAAHRCTHRDDTFRRLPSRRHGRRHIELLGITQRAQPTRPMVSTRVVGEDLEPGADQTLGDGHHLRVVLRPGEPGDHHDSGGAPLFGSPSPRPQPEPVGSGENGHVFRPQPAPPTPPGRGSKPAGGTTRSRRRRRGP